MDKKSGSRCELKKIKKTKAKTSKNCSYSIINISSSNSDSYFSLSIDSDWEEIRQTTYLKEKNKLYYVVTNNTKKNKNQHHYAIEYKPNFDDKISLSRGTKDPLQVVTFILRRGRNKMQK